MFCSQNDHPPSLFDQTVRDADEEFYATFPEARDALARSTAIFSDNTTPNDDLNLMSLSYSQDQQEFSRTDPVNDTHNSHNNISLPNYNFSYTPPSFFDPVSLSPPIPFALLSDQIRSQDTRIVPILQGRKPRRALRSPTQELTNGCELSVMRLDDFSEPRDSGTQISYFHANQRRAHSVSHLSSRPLSWDSALNSPRSSIPLSPLFGKRQLEKKPPLACLFCRGRKIACGPPLPGSLHKTCNQCQRRSLRCEYPSESRRGMRKKKSSAVAEAIVADN